jgi:hypothetical protein
LRDINNINKIFYNNLTFKVASIIARLRIVTAYSKKNRIIPGCIELFTSSNNNNNIAYRIVGYFN